MTRTWLFDEYESTETMKENFDRLFDCREACGYMVHIKKYQNETSAIIIQGAHFECVQIHFDKNQKLIAITKQQFTDRTGEMKLVGVESIVVS